MNDPSVNCPTLFADRFAQLWQLLSGPSTEVWKHHTPGITGYERQREGLELLASILWHLELASSLAEFPQHTMEEYRRRMCDTVGVLPWEMWIQQRRGLATKVELNRIVMDYSFAETPDSALLYLIQSSLVADAAIRLDAAREIIKPISKNPSASAFATRGSLETLLSQPACPAIIQDIALVVAFRDSYMHAEKPAKPYPLSSFRTAMFGRYRLLDIFEACLVLWIELYNCVIW